MAGQDWTAGGKQPPRCLPNPSYFSALGVGVVLKYNVGLLLATTHFLETGALKTDVFESKTKAILVHIMKAYVEMEIQL